MAMRPGLHRLVAGGVHVGLAIALTLVAGLLAAWEPREAVACAVGFLLLIQWILGAADAELIPLLSRPFTGLVAVAAFGLVWWWAFLAEGFYRPLSAGLVLALALPFAISHGLKALARDF